MALFNSYDIDELKAAHKDKMADWFVKEYEPNIIVEWDVLENYLRENKNYFFDKLKQTITGLKTAEYPFETIRSFDFSKVGGGNAIYPNNVLYTYKDYASQYYKSSFDTVRYKTLNRYAIWKSKDFLKILAERLQLPENIDFVIRTRPVDDDARLFENPSISEYITQLCIRIRFSK